MRHLRFPHPLTLLVACIATAAVLTWALPVGRYDRRDGETTGRRVVVPGTYHAVEAHPVGAFAAAVAVPRGLIDAADVVFRVFVVGRAFYAIDRTGALRSSLDALARMLGRREFSSSRSAR